MQAFSCLGGECEDTCCQQWDIRFDRAHYEKLRKAVKLMPEQQSLFERYIVLNEGEQASDRNFAHIRLDDKGFCPFLDNSGLCQLHSCHGIEPLSNVCAFFPRVLSAYQGEIEMTGALSCPEVTRQCLFCEASEQQMKDMSSELLPRQDDVPLSRVVPATDADFYASQFPHVRETMIWLASHEDYAFETRQYFLSNLAHRLAPGYHQGCQPNQKLVNDELDRIRNSRTLQNLDDYYRHYSSTEPVAIAVIQAVLQLHLQQSPDDKLSQLSGRIFDAYRTVLQDQGEAEIYGDNLPPVALWHRYQENWDRLNAFYGVRLENCLSRYLVNCLQREWFVSMPDPFVYIHMLTVRLAILRFLIVSHPQLQQQMKNQAVQSELDKHLVEIVYLFARGIDHNLGFLQVLYQALVEQQMMSFDYAMPFIKF